MMSSLLSPVTRDNGGTSQVNVAAVPSWFGTRLESEIEGPREAERKWESERDRQYLGD